MCSLVIWSPSVVASRHFISYACFSSTKQSISKVLGLVPSELGILTFLAFSVPNFSLNHSTAASSKNEPAYLYKKRPLF